MKLHFKCHATLDAEDQEQMFIVKKKKTPIQNKDSSSIPTKFKSLISSAVTGNSWSSSVVTGTLFGHRRGNVHFAFQLSPCKPILLIELAMPIRTLIKEMASGVVRVALKCDRKPADQLVNKKKKKKKKLLEETEWKGYCNGMKCGAGVSSECGTHELEVLRAVGPVSVGAGVLPAAKGDEFEGEMMYVRARFERVVGSTDSEAFYMIRPDGYTGTELSIYLLRV